MIQSSMIEQPRRPRSGRRKRFNAHGPTPSVKDYRQGGRALPEGGSEARARVACRAKESGQLIG